MLRGRCSCAISECPTPSPAPKNPVSPLFPLHPRKPPVSPLFPLHTQKQGVGGGTFELSTFNFEPLFSPNSNHSRTYGPPSRKSNYSRTYAKLGVGVGYLNGNVSTICRRADIFEPARQQQAAGSARLRRAGPTQANETRERPASLLRRASRGGPYTNFQPSTLNFEPPFLGSGNILRGGCVLLDSGARGCLPRRG